MGHHSSIGHAFQGRCKEVRRILRECLSTAPGVAIVLGSGLSGIAEGLPETTIIPYSSIPYFPETAVQTHTGNIVVGTFGGRNIAFFQGRIHLYEGYNLLDIAFFPLVISMTGAKILITTNLVGGIREDLDKSDLVVITDHLNFSGYNPLIALGKAEGRQLFVDMYDAYSSKLRMILQDAAQQTGVPLKEGKLAFLSGPNFETQMELEYLRKAGADVVGWSMVPEVLVARSRGMEVLGISCVSDLSHPDHFGPVDLDDIFAQGIKQVDSLKTLLHTFVSLIPDEEREEIFH